MLRVCPTVRLPRSQGNALLQSPAFETKVNPLGNGSVTETPVASLGPLLVTLMVKTAFCPGVIAAGAILSIPTSLLETTLVGSLAASLAVLVSLPPATLAVLVRLAGALCKTLTFTVMSGKLEPKPSASLRVQVRV